MVYNGKPLLKLGWFGGTPIFGNTHIYIYTHSISWEIYYIHHINWCRDSVDFGRWIRWIRSKHCETPRSLVPGCQISKALIHLKKKITKISKIPRNNICVFFFVCLFVCLFVFLFVSLGGRGPSRLSHPSFFSPASWAVGFFFFIWLQEKQRSEHTFRMYRAGSCNLALKWDSPWMGFLLENRSLWYHGNLRYHPPKATPPPINK